VDTIKPGSAADRAAGEKAEQAISTLIAKRDKARRSDEAEQAREELWPASVRRYSASRHEELRALWCSYHTEQAARHRANLEALATYHEEQAKRHQPKGA